MNVHGNLVLQGLGQVKNLIIDTLATLPTWVAADEGRLIYVTATKTIYFGTNVAFVEVGGSSDVVNAQSEIDAIEIALGFLNSNGTIDSASLTALDNASTATSLLDVLTQLDAAITAAAGVDTLAELTDVVITAADSGDFLRHNGTNWVDAQIVAADISDLTATATELNYVDGVTSAIQDQLDAKQDGDAGLDSLAALASTGIVVASAADTFIVRELTGTASNIVVTDGDGITGNPTIDLAPVTQATSGTFSKVTLDGLGRVVGNTAVVAADITGLVDNTYINAAGDTMTGALNLIAPTAGAHAANKSYVDAAIAGLSWKNPVRVATTANIVLEDIQTIDDVLLVVGDRVLVKNQTALAENGIYLVVDGGAWTRAEDFDEGTAPDEVSGAAVFVLEGTTNADSGYTQILEVTTVDVDDMSFVQFSGSGAVVAGVGLGQSGNNIFVNMGAGIKVLPSDEVGLDIEAGKAIQLSGSGATGDQLTLVLNGSTLTQSASGLNVTLAGITASELADNAVTTNKLNADAVTNEKVADDAIQTENILNAAVTNVKLANSAVLTAGDTGTGSVALGATLSVLGGTGLSSVAATGTVTLNADVATTTTLGVASFATSDFVVTAGAVTLQAFDKSLDDLSDVALTAATASIASGEVLSTDGTNVVNKKMYHQYSGASATSHTVTHNLGQKFVNVCVYDSSDNMVIPQNIALTSANVVTVTFNAAIACSVVVMGIDTTEV